jgi:hypothetical protein
VGKLAKGFSDREVAGNLGPDYDMTEENSLFFLFLAIQKAYFICSSNDSKYLVILPTLQL